MRTPPNERVTPDIVESSNSPKSGSERRCILSGETFPRDQLIRLAISPDGLVLPDVGAKAPGRGAWIAPDRAALETALESGQFRGSLMRAFKGGPKDASLSVPDDLADRIEAGLRKQALDRLGLELRAGNIVLGSGRIGDQARTGRIALLLHASDSSEDGRKKLDQAWRVGIEEEGSGKRGLVIPLDRDALSVALGRENVVHLGVSGHAHDLRAAHRVAQAVDRLAKFVGSQETQAALPAPALQDDIKNTEGQTS